VEVISYSELAVLLLISRGTRSVDFWLERRLQKSN